MGKKYFDASWDFYGENTKEYTHGFHTYPAMMIPQVARELIKRYSNKNTKIIFDPYMGSGTTLVEAKLAGIKSIGTDLNPLARLISLVKTTNLDRKVLEKEIINFKKKISKDKIYFEKLEIVIPNFNIRDNWFKSITLQELGIIKKCIEEIEDKSIRNFFYIAFTETVRLVSYTRNGEFKLYAIEAEKKETFNPDTFEIFVKKLNENFKGLIDFNSKTENNVNSYIYNFDTILSIPDGILKNESVDLVVTSPPYGDSRTTVAYGQFSRLANEWMEFDNPSKIDTLLMGGKKTKESFRFNFSLLDEILDTIKESDKEKHKSKAREPEVISFYQDYKKSIDNISKIIKKGGYVCYVVGNRRVHNIELPTDEITKFFFEQNGFEHIETIIRNIPGKRMPSKTSPTNRAGKTVSTMKFEYIVIMRKL